MKKGQKEKSETFAGAEFSTLIEIKIKLNLFFEGKKYSRIKKNVYLQNQQRCQHTLP